MLKKSASLLLLASAMLFGCNDDNDNKPDSNVVELSATLNSAQQVPSNPSTATGTMTGTYNKTTHVLTYTVTYTGITPNAGHIHTGAPGTNGPIVIPFSDLASPIKGTATVSDATVEQNILAGNSYVNLHTTAYKDGEIRGNITVK